MDIITLLGYYSMGMYLPITLIGTAISLAYVYMALDLDAIAAETEAEIARLKKLPVKRARLSQSTTALLHAEQWER